jgi:hypothetical protein
VRAEPKTTPHQLIKRLQACQTDARSRPNGLTFRRDGNA